jgi:hypothetical protein
MRLFFVHLENQTDRADDDVVKVLASTKPKAKALVMVRSNFCLSSVMTRRQFKRWDPEWHALLWGAEPSYVQGEVDAWRK